MSAASDPARRSGEAWLFGPTPDLLLGCGLGYALFIIVLVATHASAWLAGSVSLVVAALGLVTNTPHYGATLMRVYEQRADRRRYAFFTLHLTILLAVLFVAGLHVVWIGSALITLYISWSPWHFAGQNYGLALMFLRRRGVEVDPAAKRLLHTSFVCSFLLVLLLVHGPLRSIGILPVPSFEREVYGFLSLGLPDLPTRIALAAVGITYVASLAGAGVLLLRRARPVDLAPALCLVALQATWFSVPAAFAAAGELDFTSLALSSVWIAIAHSVQYLWITSYYARRSQHAPGLPGYLLRTLLWGALATVLPALVFAPGLLGGLSYQAGLAILLFAVVNLHHFLLDGAIWKLRDGRVAAVLLRSAGGGGAGPAPIAAEPAGRLGLRAVYAAGAVCVAVAVFGIWENQIDVVRALEHGDLARAARANERLAWIGRESHAVHQQLGLKLARQKHWEGARRHLERSLEIQPSVEAFYTLGKVDVGTGDLAGARDALESGLALRPKHLPSLGLLARVLLDLGDASEASEILERASELAPANQSIRAALVRARADESRDAAAASDP